MPLQLFERFRELPMLRITLPLISGVIVAHYLPLFSASYPILGSAVLLLLAVLVGGRLSYIYRWVWGALIGGAIFLIGMSATISSSGTPAYKEGYSGIFQVQLLDVPEERAKSHRVEALITGEVLHDTIYPKQVKLLLYVRKSDSSEMPYMPGDLFLARLRLQLPPTSMNPGDFDYRNYLASKGIYFCAYPNQEDLLFLGTSGQFNPLLYFRRLRASIIEKLPTFGIEGKNLAVFSALTLGYKGLLDPDTRSDFVAAGAMHVLAVSGLHVGIVYLVVAFMVGLHQRQKRFVGQRALLVIILLWIYAFLTGLPPSVFRATVMFCFVVGAKVFRRQVNIYNSIAASAFVLVLIQPKIVYDVGFVLSYLAVISIVFFQPKIYAWFTPKGWIMEKVWGLTAVSLAAQIATTPVSVAIFGQFPIYFWLSNIAVILLATLILYLSVPFAIIASISAVAGLYAGKVLSILVFAMRWSTDFVEQLPGSLIKGLNLSLWQTLAIIVAIASLAFYAEMRKKLAFFITLACLAFTFVFYGWTEIKHKRQAFIGVMSVRSTLVIALVEGEVATFVTNANSIKMEQVANQLSNFVTFYHIKQHEVIAMDDSTGLAQSRLSHIFIANGSLLAFGYGGKRILIQLGEGIRSKAKGSPVNMLKADLVVTSSAYSALKLRRYIQPSILAVNGYLPHRMVNDSLARDFWSIPVQGPYFLSIKE